MVSRFQQLMDSFYRHSGEGSFSTLMHSKGSWTQVPGCLLEWPRRPSFSEIGLAGRLYFRALLNGDDPRPFPLHPSLGLQHGALSPSFLFPTSSLLSRDWNLPSGKHPIFLFLLLSLFFPNRS